MLSKPGLQSGVSMIELIIGVAIVGSIVTLGMPSFATFIKNSQVRTSAESILNGLQLARAEAVRRNANVRFDLTDGSGLVAWSVGCVTATATCPASIQSKSSAEAASSARVGVNKVVNASYATALAGGAGLPNGVTFNSSGRVPVGNVGDDITRIDVTQPADATARRMVIIVNPGGAIRMCDPAVTLASSPRGCI